MFVLKFIFIFYMFINSSYATDCTPTENVSLVFSNGMFNDLKDIRNSLNGLKDLTKSKYKNYDYAQNLNETPLLQLLEVYYQKKSSNNIFLWTYFSELNGPRWFTKITKIIAQEYTKQSYVIDQDLQSHIKKYKDYLNDELDILVVSHSQGNFYANRAFEVLAESHKYLDNKMGIVAIASPDSYVAGLGEHRTLNSDSLIRSIPGSLPANINNENSGLIDHEFIKHYLKGFPSGSKIEALLKKTAKNLLTDTFYFEPGYLDKSLIKMDKWVRKLNDGKITRVLDNHECLAVSLFLKNKNWFGVNCTNRNLYNMKEGAEICYKDEWSDSNKVIFGCGLYGLDQNLTNWSSSFESYLVFQDHDECKWSPTKVHSELTRNTIIKAFEFIKKPI